jgi:hypothetical protein
MRAAGVFFLFLNFLLAFDTAFADASGVCGFDSAPRVHELWRFIAGTLVVQITLLTLCSVGYAVRLHVVMPAFPGRRLLRLRRHEHFD